MNAISRLWLGPSWAVMGERGRQWVAVGPTELDCVREMARCLGELKASGGRSDPRPLSVGG